MKPLLPMGTPAVLNDIVVRSGSDFKASVTTCGSAYDFHIQPTAEGLQLVH